MYYIVAYKKGSNTTTFGFILLLTLASFSFTLLHNL